MTVNYRQGYDIFASNGILFNHESPRRGETFVTRKITRAIANILEGDQDKLYLGNLDAKRDWGYAPEYVEAMWHILQQDKADDFVIATGESRSVREFVSKAFSYAGIEIEWKGKGLKEKGVVKAFNENFVGEKSGLSKGREIIFIDPKYFRPTEVDYLLGDISKARKILKWQPRIKFEELVKIMVDHDMLLRGMEPVGEGIAASHKKGFGWTNHSYSFYENRGER